MRNSRVVCMVGCPRGPPHVCLKGPRMWWVENLTLSDSSTKSSSRHSSDRATPTGHEDAGVGGGRQEPVDGLGPRRVQENQARRLYSSVPGGLTSTAPVFCIPPDPFPRGDNGLRAGHQVEPGDECCLDFEEPVVPAESTSIREGDGGGASTMECAGRQRPVTTDARLANSRARHAAAIDYYFRTRRRTHTLGRHIIFSSASQDGTVRGNDGDSLTICQGG